MQQTKNNIEMQVKNSMDELLLACFIKDISDGMVNLRTIMKEADGKLTQIVLNVIKDNYKQIIELFQYL